MGIQDRDYWKDRDRERSQSINSPLSDSLKQPAGKVYANWGIEKQPMPPKKTHWYFYMFMFWVGCGLSYAAWYGLSFACVDPESIFLKTGICELVFDM